MHPVFDPVAPYRYLLSNMYLSLADIENPDLLTCGRRIWVSLDIDCFCEEHCQPSGGSTWPAFQNTVNRVPIAGGVDTIYTVVCQNAVIATHQMTMDSSKRHRYMID